MSKINTRFRKDLEKFGTFDFKACYHCGNCTAICSLTNQEESFPRNMLRYSIVGLEGEIKSSLKPWLCYYCGECSTHCPQYAYPGELMMTLRRWLTACYDWTVLSGLFYRSGIANLFAFLLVSAGVIFFGASQHFNLAEVMHTGHLFEMIAIGGVFALVLFPNIVRMWWFTVAQSDIKVPLKKYFQSIGELFIHMFTQKRSRSCDDHQFRWLEHFVLVIGYLSLLGITVFLNWFSTSNSWVIVTGYGVSAVVFTVTAHFMIDRIRKTKELNHFSQPSDWLFVIWLFLMGISAFGVRLLIDLGWIEQNTWLYMVHLIILAQWAMIIVPFGKWTHFLYRSFAMYFERVISGS